MIGIPLTTACYVMVNVAYLAVLSPTEMMTSEAVAVVNNPGSFENETAYFMKES